MSDAPSDATKDAGDSDTYALKAADLPEIDAPDIAYRPPMPQHLKPRIGMIGTGGISGSHLDAYAKAGWTVAALWNRTPDKARAKAQQFCPQARIEEDWRAILSNPDIDVVDITLHPEHRTEIVRAAIKAGKHVLSQKPFVTDLDEGIDLVKLAQDRGVKLAVNQNARWAPHYAWMREAARGGHVGRVLTVHTAVHWSHGWTAGTSFDEIPDLILYDFGVHWFDFLNSVAGDRVEAVFASAVRGAGQANKVPLLAQAMVRMEGGQASVVFDGGIAHGPRDTSFIGGTSGALASDGPDLSRQRVTLTTRDGIARPKLEGQWFNDGFAGTMGELLCAIEEDREPSNGAAENLRSLAMAFAAVRSRMTGKEVEIGAARRLES